jgi:hypothetical protein
MGTFFQELGARLRTMWRQRTTELHELEERTLKDIGLDRSEIASVDSESHSGELTRLRIAPSR